jgi:hypothetical protein
MNHRGFSRTNGGNSSTNAQAESNFRNFNRMNSDAASRFRSSQAMPPSAGDTANHQSFNQFRRFSSNNNSNGQSASDSAVPSPSSDGQQLGNGFGGRYSANRATTARFDSDRFRSFANQQGNQSGSSDAAGSSNANRFQQSDGSFNRGKLSNLSENNSPGENSGNNARRWNRTGGNNGNATGRELANQSFGKQFGRSGDGQPGGGEKFSRSKWSKDGGHVNATTERWFGKSGFGDHRGRGGRHDDDHEFANSVRSNWNKNWNKHWDNDGHHDKHGHHRGHNHFPFALSWWAGYNYSPYFLYSRGDYWRRDPYFWWNRCSAPLLTNWVSFGWNHPCYWDYGYDEYVYYRNNYVYVDGQPYGTALDYYAQVRGLARSVPALTREQWAGIDWLPLGVFAVTRPGAATSNELVQLAVSKDGFLSGTLYNQTTGTARPLAGMVDQATQRAAWALADAPQDPLVVETSLYNLSEPECTALAHLGPVSTEVWSLVRLEQPASPAAPPAAPLPAPR